LAIGCMTVVSLFWGRKDEASLLTHLTVLLQPKGQTREPRERIGQGR